MFFHRSFFFIISIALYYNLGHYFVDSEEQHRRKENSDNE